MASESVSSEELARRICAAIVEITQGEAARAVDFDALLKHLSFDDRGAGQRAVAFAQERGWIGVNGTPVISVTIRPEGLKIATPSAS